MTWVPLDAIGQVYVDWILAVDPLPTLVNMVHPKPTTWGVILRGLREEISGDLEVVSLNEWVRRLEDAEASCKDLSDIVESPTVEVILNTHEYSSACIEDSRLLPKSYPYQRRRTIAA